MEFDHSEWNMTQAIEILNNSKYMRLIFYNLSFLAVKLYYNTC